MRFIANGPDIPNQLLEQRDIGNVVFLCGAGVSIPSKLPSFERLTRKIIDKLALPASSPIYKAFSTWNKEIKPEEQHFRVPLDHIFHLLQKEYGRGLIGRYVSNELSEKDGKKFSSQTHDIVSRISTSADGNSQIVTTNFDRLFECVGKHKNSRIYVPPTFPDIQHGVSVAGITYLHGRLSNPEDQIHDYILSSADFGRAYLAQGWATSFVRRLLRQYTVILIGYQAEDPPIKYLLQGLSISESEQTNRLFAFDEGTQEKVESKWRDLGVVPISYPDSSNHSALWDSLDKWAAKCDSPIQWKNNILQLAQQSPKNLNPHQREIVANLIRDPIGAKQFSEAEPPPNIEWLCVFDPKCRSGLPYYSPKDNKIQLNPVEAYGLDCDPPVVLNPFGESTKSLENYLQWNSGDQDSNHNQQIGSNSDSGLTKRLQYLCGWMLKYINSPLLAWWLAKQNGIHPEFKTILRYEMNRMAVTEAGVKPKLALILTGLESKQREYTNVHWHSVCEQVKIDGWNRETLELLYQAFAPYINISTIYGVHSVCPPTGDWDSSEMHNVANLEITFPQLHSEPPDISDEDLLKVFNTCQQCFHKAGELFNELENPFLTLPTLYPENLNAKNILNNESEAHILWFKKLFERLVNLQPRKLKAYVEIWPDSDRFILSKFRFYAWNKSELFSSQEIHDSIVDLPTELFWSRNSARELLFLLRDRWSEFSKDQTIQQCEKVFQGSDMRKGEDNDEYANRKNTEIVQWVLWLNKNGCVIPDEFLNKAQELKENLNIWYDEWIDSVAKNPVSTHSSYSIETNEDTSIFANVPISDIINIAEQIGTRPRGERTEYKPFQGLIKEAPQKALLALTSASKQRDISIHYWGNIISNWPESAPAKAAILLLGRIVQLPAERIIEIRSTIGYWFESSFSAIIAANKDFAFNALDQLLDKVLLVDDNSKDKHLIYSENQEVDYSLRTYDQAMNSFVGRVVEGILKALDKLQTDEGIPVDFSNRFEQLLSLKDDISEHTLCVLAINAGWLYQIDSEWTIKHLVPCFSPKSTYCEPAWNAILHLDWTKNIAIFGQIKPYFLALPLESKKWNWHNQDFKNNLGVWTLQAVTLAHDNKPHLTNNEAKNILRQLSQVQLSHCIWFLGRIGRENENFWREKVLPFIKFCWPPERKLMSKATTESWVSILENTGSLFPEMFNEVRDFLTPLLDANLNLYSFYNRSLQEKSVTTQFPAETLTLLDMILPDHCFKLPYGLSNILNLLLETQPSLESDKKFQRLQNLIANSNGAY